MVIASGLGNLAPAWVGLGLTLLGALVFVLALGPAKRKFAI